MSSKKKVNAPPTSTSKEQSAFMSFFTAPAAQKKNNSTESGPLKRSSQTNDDEPAPKKARIGDEAESLSAVRTSDNGKDEEHENKNESVKEADTTMSNAVGDDDKVFTRPSSKRRKIVDDDDEECSLEKQVASVPSETDSEMSLSAVDDDADDDIDDEGDDSASSDGGPRMMKLSTKTAPVARASKTPVPKNSKPINIALQYKQMAAFDPMVASWKAGKPVPYSALAQTFAAIENETKRLKITEILCSFLRSVIALSPDDLLPTVYLCFNEIAPAFAGLELGIGDSILMGAIAESTGRTLVVLKGMYDELGDLGIVAQESRNTQRTLFKPAALTVRGVFKELKAIAGEKGNASQAKKRNRIKGLLVACEGSEAQYVIRALQGKLRIGLAGQSILVALAHALTLTPPSPDPSKPPATLNAAKDLSVPALRDALDEAELLIKTVYAELPSFDDIIPAILKHGFHEVRKYCYLKPGIPIKPMLAHPTKGIGEVLDRFNNMAFTCEYKYDGERAQVHIDNGKISIFSRNSEDNTSKYPDLIEMLPTVMVDGVTSAVLDCEAVAFDRATDGILPFQVLSTRKKKNANADEITVQVCLFAFDLLYLNGNSLLTAPFRERRQKLHESFKEEKGKFMFAIKGDCTDTEEIQKLLEESIKGNCEGLMVKTLDVDSTYEVGKRSHSWLKVKKDYLDGVGDTLDLTVVGGYFGKGKRTGTYGGFLLACYDEESETFQTICKIGTGFKDDDLAKHYEFFKEHVLEQPKSYYSFSENTKPDVWFEPVQVWEVLAADLSISPVHMAAQGLVDPVKGISLRFPRFLRIRDDKTPETGTNSAQVAVLYNAQGLNKQSSGPPRR